MAGVNFLSNLSNLPHEEYNSVALLIVLYNANEYKQVLEAADANLENFPDQRESLCMKALTLHSMGCKEESYSLVKSVIVKNLNISDGWHLQGELYRRDREYSLATKSYENARRCRPHDIDILTELANVQAQMRNWKGFMETNALMWNNSVPRSWIGLAVACHLRSLLFQAIQVLDSYEVFNPAASGIHYDDDYSPCQKLNELSEMLLYKVSLLEKYGLFERALEELREKRSKIVDQLSYKELEASLHVKLGLVKEASNLYEMLLLIDDENYSYYEGFQKCVGPYSEVMDYSPADIEKLDEFYKTLQQKNPCSSAAKRIPLDFLQGEKFREAAEIYIQHLLTKGVPSLFSDLLPLYDQPGKANILEHLILVMETSLKATGRYPGRLEKEPPSTFMWSLFLVAQHFDRRSQYDIALAKINEAISHTPTVIDLYSAKSRILKHAGDLTAAAALADKARRMNLADPYLNSKCVKRMLQSDQVVSAEKTAVFFMKDRDQLWYELASGESYFRQGDIGRALKKFLAVEKHYSDISYDRMDYYSCSKKMTLRAYVEMMLNSKDGLHSHPYFHKAVSGAIRCYIELFDSPPNQKKLRAKQKKAEARKKKAESNPEETSESTTSKSGKPNVKHVDPDPNGLKLLQVEDPLMEATKYLKLLQRNSSNSLETHLLSFEVNMRKPKILLAFQAVKNLLRLDAENPDSHRCLIRFFNKIGTIHAPLTYAEFLVRKVLKEERSSISQLHEKSLLDANMFFLKKNEESLMHRAAAAEMLYLLEPNKKSEAVKILVESSNNKVSLNGALGPVGQWKLKECISVHELLERVLIDKEAALRWKNQCAQHFPYSTWFEGSCSSVCTSEYKKTKNGATNHSQPDSSIATTSPSKPAQPRHSNLLPALEELKQNQKKAKTGKKEAERTVEETSGSPTSESGKQNVKAADEMHVQDCSSDAQTSAQAVEMTPNLGDKEYTHVPFESNCSIGNLLGTRLREGLNGFEPKAYVLADPEHSENIEYLRNLGLSEYVVSVDRNLNAGPLGEHLQTEPLIPVSLFFEKHLEVSYQKLRDSTDPKREWWRIIKTPFLNIFRDTIHAMIYLDSVSLGVVSMENSIFISREARAKVLPSFGPPNLNAIFELIKQMKEIITLPFKDKLVGDGFCYGLPLELNSLFSFFDSRLYDITVYNVPIAWLYFHPFFWTTRVSVAFLKRLQVCINNQTIFENVLYRELKRRARFTTPWTDKIQDDELLYRILRYANTSYDSYRLIDILRYFGAVLRHVNESKYVRYRGNICLSEEQTLEFLLQYYPTVVLDFYEAMCDYSVVDEGHKFMTEYAANEVFYFLMEKYGRENVEESMVEHVKDILNRIHDDPKPANPLL